MSVFEPKTVRAIILATISSAGKRKEFEATWNKTIEQKTEKWLACRDGRSEAQLKWEAAIVAYIQYVYKQTSLHGNTKKDTIPLSLDTRIPILGPRFIPPTYLCLQKRSSLPNITPDTTYLKPLNVVHPFYHPKILSVCPRCGSHDVLWDDWTATGHREVHGMQREETALGYQLRCNPCHKRYGGKRAEGEAKEPFCFATTSDEFWKKWEYWAIPRDIPIFFKRSAVTRQLLDFILELRPATTSGGLAENINQLHLLEYHQTVLEYLRALKDRGDCLFSKCPLQVFSSPTDPKGYNDKPVTADLITDILLQHNERTRGPESREWMRTLTGVTISLDNTFKVVAKATIVDKKCTHTKVLRGGVLSCINERNEIISWRMCETKSNRELGELLEGIVRRCEALEIELPILAIFDNCCQVEAEVRRVLLEIHVGLDVRHFKERYMAIIQGGMRNKHRTAVGNDIVDSVLKTRAKDGIPATYYSREEQAERLQSMYNKYDAMGTVHRDQMAHVQKGCLTRPRDDIPSDGSRIEGSHKGWNSIMRSHASGIEVFSALANEYVHRRNMRTAHRQLESDSKTATPPPSFITFTHGTHHTRLVDHIAGTWNTLLDSELPTMRRGLSRRPKLLPADSNETFGLVLSTFAVPNAELIELEVAKQEGEDTCLALLQDLNINSALTNVSADAAESKATVSVPTGLAPVVAATAAVETMVTVCATLVADNPDPTTTLRKTRPTDNTSTLSGVAVGKRKVVVIDDTDEQPSKRVCTVPGFTSSLLPNSPTTGISSERPVGHGIEAYFKSRVPHASEPESSNTEVASSSKLLLANPAQPPCPAFSVLSNTVCKPPEAAKPSDAGTSVLPGATLSDASPPTVSGEQSALSPGDVAPHVAPPTAAGASSSIMDSLTPLVTPLPLPTGSGLTRSEAFFAKATGVDPRALSFKHSSEEYYLFMDMRSELQWASFRMTAMQVTLAGHLYNARLKTMNEANQLPAIAKQPRALFDMLVKTEVTVEDRVARNDYVARSSGKETFWRHHCAAVSLVRPDLPPGKSGKGPKRISKCKRCGVIRYIGGVGSDLNHRTHYCTDGVRSTKVDGASIKDEPPRWPQPSGLFSKGEKFHPIIFLRKIHDLYGRLVVQGVGTGGGSATTSEEDAFAQMVGERVQPLPNGKIGFRLYPHTALEPQLPAGFIVPGVDGVQYLRLDCLSEPPCAAPTPAPSSTST